MTDLEKLAKKVRELSGGTIKEKDSRILIHKILAFIFQIEGFLSHEKTQVPVDNKIKIFEFIAQCLTDIDKTKEWEM